MFEFRRPAVSRLILICTLLTLPAQAWATDLTGAWASDVSQCGKVFVADGNQLRGRTARCTIKSRKQVGRVAKTNASGASTRHNDST
jgi:hypothetical protein